MVGDDPAAPRDNMPKFFIIETRMWVTVECPKCSYKANQKQTNKVIVCPACALKGVQAEAESE